MRGPQKNLITSCYGCSTAYIIVHAARTTVYIIICICNTSYHLSCISVVFVLDLREVLSPCLVPPAATGITLKNVFDKYIPHAAFCCRTAAVCMAVWIDKPTLAALAGSRHWSFSEVATNTRTWFMWHVGLLRGPWGCFSLQYLDNCECIDITMPACCAFSLPYL